MCFLYIQDLGDSSGPKLCFLMLYNVKIMGEESNISSEKLIYHQLESSDLQIKGSLLRFSDIHNKQRSECKQ